MHHRRSSRLALLALCLPLALAAGEASSAVLDAEPAPADLVAMERAFTLGLDYLESQRSPDGYWQNTQRLKREQTTVWVLLAFLANGHTPQRGPYQRTVSGGLDWLVKEVGGVIDIGLYRRRHPKDSSRDIGHFPYHYLFACLMAAGMGTEKVASEDLMILCEHGVRQMLEMQARPQEGSREMAVGGWGGVEASYWVTLCLLSARRIGIAVPDVALDDAARYWKLSYQPAFGTFREMNQDPGENLRERYALRATIALSLLGEQRSTEVQECLALYLRPMIKEIAPDPSVWFWQTIGRCDGGYHRKFQAARQEMNGFARVFSEWWLALSLSGASGAEAEQVRQLVIRHILEHQNDDGTFRHPGRERFLDPGNYYRGGKGRSPNRYDHQAREQGIAYPTPHWCTMNLGYGADWTEVMITAQALYALGITKNYLPAFIPWRNRAGAAPAWSDRGAEEGEDASDE